MNSSYWQKVSLGDVCDVVAGGTPSRKNPKYFGGDIPWVKISDMLQGLITFTDETITKAGLENSTAKILPSGTILISIFATIGRTATLGIDAATNQAIVGVIPKPETKLNTSFLRYCLDNSILKLTKEARGVAQININGKILKSLEIPLPPLPEQERIVRLLDEAESLRAERAHANDRMEQFVPALFQETFGDPPKIEFPVKTLHEVAEVVSGIAKGRKFNGQKPVTIKYLRVANVQAGYLDLSEIKTIEALPSEVEALQVRIGDVLLTEGGDFDKLGRGAMLEVDLPNCIHQNHVFRARVNQDYLLPIFFHDYLQTQQAKKYFLSCAKKTTNLASINLTQLRALPVPLPPLALQREFAARVGEARGVQSAQGKSSEKIEALYQSMLSRAFAGEL